MKNILFETSQQEKNRILEMHKKATNKHYLVNEQGEQLLKVGSTYESTMQDNAEGLILKVLKITPIQGCDVKEIELQSRKGAIKIGYIKGANLIPGEMSRTAGGGKSPNPCVDFKDMMSFGNLEPEGTRAKEGLD
jgi:hypothetical protein